MDSLEARFLCKIEKTKTCWFWKGSIVGGYGQIANGRNRTARAHRVAYELFNGQIPTGMVVHHICGVKNCVNPNHLKAMTQRDNIKDAVRRGYRKPYKSIFSSMVRLKTTIQVPEELWNAFANKTIEVEKRSGKRNAIICNMIKLYVSGKLKVSA